MVQQIKTPLWSIAPDRLSVLLMHHLLATSEKVRHNNIN